jgi:hypothetical protein
MKSFSALFSPNPRWIYIFYFWSTHEYRLRVGSFRVLFVLENDLISVYAVKDRKEVYE